MVAHSAGHPKLASILQFREQLAFKNEKDVPPIAPMVRHVTGAIFNQSDTNIAHRDRTPTGETGFSRMFGQRDVLPIHNLEG